MDSEDEILIGLLILAAGLITLQKKKSAKWLNRRWWVRPINFN